MKIILFILAILSAYSVQAQIQPDTQRILGVRNKLLGDPNGNKCYSMLQARVGEGTKIFFADTAEVEKIAGHSGGGIVQDATTGKYSIYVNRTLSMNHIARAICHEVQHVTDEVDFDAYLKTNRAMDVVGKEVISAIKLGNLAEYAKSKPQNAEMVMKGLFCQELRAYGWSGILDGTDKSIRPIETTGKISTYVYEHYIKSLGFNFKEDLAVLEKECLARSSYSEYMKSFESSVGNSRASENIAPGAR